VQYNTGAALQAGADGRTHGRSLNETELMTGRENANRTWRIRRAGWGKAPMAAWRPIVGWNTDGRGEAAAAPSRAGRYRSTAASGRESVGRSVGRSDHVGGGNKRTAGRAGPGRTNDINTDTHIELPTPWPRPLSSTVAGVGRRHAP